MNTFTLVIIMMTFPLSNNGGVSGTLVVPGFTSEQACMNAARKIMLPKPPGTYRLEQKNSAACVATSI